MSLQQAPRSRVFVELVPWADRGRENNVVSDSEFLPGLRRPLPSAQTQTATREVHVSGTAELSASPDRAQVAVLVSSTKETAAEAKKSVCRRLDYITQSLQQQGLQAENVTVTKDFRRVENAYHMEAEVCITFTEFGKMQNICNFLIEKLDSSVVISQPQFYHTPSSVENLRDSSAPPLGLGSEDFISVPKDKEDPGFSLHEDETDHHEHTLKGGHASSQPCALRDVPGKHTWENPALEPASEQNHRRGLFMESSPRGLPFDTKIYFR
ncbi:interleukin-1 receptor-associated kinase 1-binding protein 1 isoform X1 [Meles meles]|uniref:interleukin-1 receptor-associated kinase 1-binding protein 1 isoform X1 n=1 Tax=Meles meles TaxID=9662 RepID=UPI001E69C99F|nr:interleukin-1 receptor-associated kinase 1-binding protein 1 isoform X1 [Meles meles]